MCSRRNTDRILPLFILVGDVGPVLKGPVWLCRSALASIRVKLEGVQQQKSAADDQVAAAGEQLEQAQQQLKVATGRIATTDADVQAQKQQIKELQDRLAAEIARFKQDTASLQAAR